MTAKTFDCVQVKRRGALRVYEETKGMTREQELAYWRKQDEEFRAARRREAEKQAADPPGRA